MTTAHQYEMLERMPTTEEHSFLWEAVGWGNVNTEMTVPERYGFQNHAPGMTGMFKVME